MIIKERLIDAERKSRKVNQRLLMIHNYTVNLNELVSDYVKLSEIADTLVDGQDDVYRVELKQKLTSLDTNIDRLIEILNNLEKQSQ